jgi:DNA helicase-2/ATP-dependent DNA helicase PcrA
MQAPNRYVSTDLITRICREAVGRETSVTDLLAASMGTMHDRTAERVERFLETAEGLLKRLDDPAHETVGWLIEALDYEEHLRRHSAFEELADRRIRTARSLIDFSRGHSDTASVLARIKEISFDRPERGPQTDVLEIQSIHRAKGREWPVVFVPGCNDGTIPTSLDDRGAASAPPGKGTGEDDGGSTSGTSAARQEEERRLFYVALTRAKEELRLSYDRTEPPSPFLEEADVEHRLALCEQVRRVTERPADDWTAEDVAWLCIGAGELHLHRYLEAWWRPAAEQRRALAAHLGRPETLQEAATTAIGAHVRQTGAQERTTESADESTDASSEQAHANRDPQTDEEDLVDKALAQRLQGAFEQGRSIVEGALGLDPAEADPSPVAGTER